MVINGIVKLKISAEVLKAILLAAAAFYAERPYLTDTFNDADNAARVITELLSMLEKGGDDDI